ncbi:hypothetical protein AB7C87_14965 [Natrarchaeobius sp. A-rgal3]|uniref:hypothetical protein n=1 Tax=Natrarchaeobius versutus TaxID=1679078 RepID=UPI00350F813D
MTPVAMLAGFCAVMAVVAVLGLVTDDDRDLVDVGTTLIVVAITALASWWLALEEGWLAPTGQIALLAVAGLLGVLGVGLVVRYWDRTDVATNASRPSADDTTTTDGDESA